MKGLARFNDLKSPVPPGFFFSATLKQFHPAGL